VFPNAVNTASLQAGCSASCVVILLNHFVIYWLQLTLWRLVDKLSVFTSLYAHSVALVCERTIPNEPPPLVGEVTANFYGQRVPCGQGDWSLRTYSWISRPEPLLYIPSSSSVVLTRLSGPRPRPTASQKIWWGRKSNPDFWICSQELLITRPQRQSYVHTLTLFCNFERPHANLPFQYPTSVLTFHASIKSRNFMSLVSRIWDAMFNW
jgi:hypothetical protein